MDVDAVVQFVRGHERQRDGVKQEKRSPVDDGRDDGSDGGGDGSSSLMECMVDHMFLSGAYFGVNTCALLRREADFPASKFLALADACRCHNTGAYAGNVGLQPHVLYTYSALQLRYLSGDAEIADHASPADQKRSLKLLDVWLWRGWGGELPKTELAAAMTLA
ncbi:hypothetical protein PTSG_13248 [Salpingoeca rosetta]|uniref:Uncharacterized protein n=1 Tax=Salpingoeca rosetta (strain ATCC 50818 / BSB-021) TaxID=946362 RepID=F2UC97_SALR5|nr:uncharacterized protein PTSG_13248 [Salpingoeca rosetta]EGD74204.1 hypothetical protein PTSG_13248 [Salpingoeca rosetta]|eukprot:XP_004993104.1 hypothetical protein PTSG_13248 [Salpingoeca rosetta]